MYSNNEGTFPRGVIINRSKPSGLNAAARSRFAFQDQLAEVGEAVAEVREQIRGMLCAVSALASEKQSGDWLDSREAADYLRMSKTTFEKHLYSGPIKIKSYLVGGKRLFKRSDVDRWVMTHRDKLKGYA
jgi:excisionase family DNA binding protein